MIRYDVNSGIYKLWKMCNVNLTVDNLFSDFDVEQRIFHGKLVPNKNFCSFWRSILLYLFVQAPIMLALGAILAFSFVLQPLMALILLISDPSMFLQIGQDHFVFGVAVLIIYATILVTLTICKLFSIYKNGELIKTIELAYESKKNKFCPSIDFYNSKEEKDDKCN